MTENNDTEERRIETGDYVVGIEQSPYEAILFEVVDTWEDGRGTEMARVERVLDDERENHAMPFGELEHAEPNADAGNLLGSFRSRTPYEPTKGGVFTLADPADFCEVCGSNAVAWASDPHAGVGMDWCDTCGNTRTEP